MARHAKNSHGKNNARGSGANGAAADARDANGRYYRNREDGGAHDATVRKRRSGHGGRRGHAADAKVSRPAKKQPRKKTVDERRSSMAVYVVGIAAVVALVAIVLIAVRSCVPTTVYDYDGELDPNYQNPIKGEDLQSENGRLFHVDNGVVDSRLGIDVSENQDVIDWKAVAKDGIEFAIIRLGYRGATEGDLYLDAHFAENLAGAKEAGLDCGVYFFSQAINEKEAVEEAEYVIKALDGAKLEYPVAFDYESAVAGVDAPRSSNLDKDQMSALADAFCKRIEEAGYYSMIYGNYYDLDLYHYDYLKDKTVWWAEYDVDEPHPNMDIVFWQYDSGGWVEGIDTLVDMNLHLPTPEKKEG